MVVVSRTQVLLAKKPDGIIRASDFKVQHSEFDPSTADVPEGSVILQLHKLEIGAFIRTMLDVGEANDVHGGGLELMKQPVPAIGLGTVIRSSAPDLAEGTVVTGMVAADTHPTAVATQLQVVRSPEDGKLSEEEMTNILSVLSMACGVTAYVGFNCVLGPPEKGQVAVVSAAAGGVGTVICQLAKVRGCVVIGIAGGEAKTALLKDELQLDGVVDHKDSSKSVEKQLKEVAPDGVDFFFDNVGGETLDAVLSCIRPEGKIVICGAASQYSGNINSGKVVGPTKYLQLTVKSAKMGGFVIHMPPYVAKVPEAVGELKQLLKKGLIKAYVTEEEGIDNFPTAMEKMFTGGHTGRLLVRV